MPRSWTSTFSIDLAQQAAADGAAEGLEQGAARVLDDSQRRVPFIKGDLARSGDSGLLSPTRAAVTYRDRGAVGAHERTEIRPANGRERKFLETAMTSTRDEVAELIAAAVRRRLGT